jgi:hypothetical protein
MTTAVDFYRTDGLVAEGECDEAVATSARAWRAQGQEVDVFTGSEVNRLGLYADGIHAALVAANPRLIECFVTDDADYKALYADLARLNEARWNVWVLMPTRCLGVAHQELRGLDIRLQGWWTDGGCRIRFGTDETP